MLVKLDENLSNSHVIFLQEAGYECDRVTDEVILQLVLKLVVNTSRLRSKNDSTIYQ
jgi:hypothetical protein